MFTIEDTTMSKPVFQAIYSEMRRRNIFNLEGVTIYIMVKAPHGTEISCKGWLQEAALRMLMNNLDPEVAERPEDLIVYGGRVKAARNTDCYNAIVKSLQDFENKF